MSADAVDVLNRVLAILRRSFVQYVRYARPYMPPGREQALETFHKIADEQDALAERVNHEIVKSGGWPDSGDFAMEFTDTHDLGIDYVIREAIGYQKQDVAALGQLANAPNPGRAAKALVDEALGLAKAHLEALERLGPRSDNSTIV
jgi:hypothetical protein